MDDFYDENKFHEAKDDIKKLSEMIPEQKILSGIKENINMADKNKNNSEKVSDSQDFCVSLH